MSILERVKDWLKPAQPLSKQILHYQTPPDADQQYRLHLRLEEDGRGLLIVNAATVLHLNQTAAEHARLLVQGADADEAARTIAARYRIGQDRARQDFIDLRERILTLATTEDLDPVTYLDMERAEPFSAETSAPYRVDLALTYRVDESGKLDPEARKRVDHELSTEQWERILDKLWDVGVPHVCFTGGEPTLRDDLVDLIRHAERLGQVTGLLTDGHRLRNEAYLNELLQAGLDHLQITLASHVPEIHDRIVGMEGAWKETDAGLRLALAADICVVVHVVVTPANVETVADTVTYLAELGVPGVALSSPLESAASEEERRRLQQALQAGEEAAHRHEVKLVWNLAAPYSQVNPVEMETQLSADQVARQRLYVEPDGDVLPTQGYNVLLGNLLRDPWESIWEHPERRKLGEGAS